MAVPTTGTGLRRDVSVRQAVVPVLALVVLGFTPGLARRLSRSLESVDAE